MTLTRPQPVLARRATRRAAVLAALLAALSLPVWHTPSYDPTAWLIWGDQITDGTLSTLGGPSWKPGTVAITTVLSLLGREPAAWAWLWVARFAGLMAIVLIAVVVRRLGGDRRAALIGGAAFALATDVLFNCFRGDSEGLLVCAALLAVLAHLDGRHHLALLAGAAAGLIRPEVWPLLAASGLWLLWRRRTPATALFVVATGAALLAAWLVPEHLASGNWFRAATRAQNPVEGSPGQSAVPFLAAFAVAAIMLCWPVYAGAVARVLAAWRAPRPRPRDDHAVLVLAAASTALMLMVAIGAEIGFTGNLRYATLPATGLCVLGGLGLPGLVVAVRRRVPAAGQAVLAAAAGVAVAISAGVVVWGAVRLTEDERLYGSDLPALIERAGGPARLAACGPVAASPFERQALAWRLGVAPVDVSTGRTERGTLIARNGSAILRNSPLPLVAAAGKLRLEQRCGA